ncbi:MAG: chemotaxis protein CheD [Lawsonibacter sp.]|nr:chemotaxis protein CheD [Lawsonibacter sp.]
MDDKLKIGIADMKMAQGTGMLVTYALGSCIGICLQDPKLKLGALIHIMLPLNMEPGRKNPMKYADTGIRETVKQLEAKGASRARLTAKIAGGAKMFESSGALGNIGQRNIDSVHMNLKKEGIRLLKEDVGGSVARTLLFDVNTGLACIRCYGRPELII